MNKTELIAAMAEKAGLTKVDAGKALNAYVEAVKEQLAKGEKVTLVGFGTFGVSERPARTGRNPRTGAKIKIAAKKAAKFKAGKGLL
jgi:DNA-binding protein HU-beta